MRNQKKNEIRETKVLICILGMMNFRFHVSNSKNNSFTFVDHIDEPNIADTMCIIIIAIWASVTSTLPNLRVPETYVCQ